MPARFDGPADSGQYPGACRFLVLTGKPLWLISMTNGRLGNCPGGSIMSLLMLQFFYFLLREFGVFTDDIDGESVGQHLSGGCRTFFCSSFCPSFRSPFRPFREDVIAEDDDIVEVAVVSLQLVFAEAVELEAFASLRKAWSGGVIRDFAGVEEIYPLLQRHFRPFVEVVDPEDIIFGIQLADCRRLEGFLLERGEAEQFVGMDAAELRLSVVDGVRAAAQSEIDDIDAVYLSDVLVSFSPVDVFGDQFGNAEQHALEIGVLVVVLNLEENQGTFGVLGKDVDAVVLVELAFLVAFAFEKFPDGDFLVEQGGQQPFQYGKVRFIPK